MGGVTAAAGLGWLRACAAAGCELLPLPLLRLPLTPPFLRRCCAGVETVFDLMEMEDDARRELLQMSEPQLEDVARWCNRYPDISVNHQVRVGRDGWAGTSAASLGREGHGSVALLCRSWAAANCLRCRSAVQIADVDEIRAGEPVSLTVALEREGEGELRPVAAPR